MEHLPLEMLNIITSFVTGFEKCKSKSVALDSINLKAVSTTFLSLFLEYGHETCLAPRVKWHGRHFCTKHDAIHVDWIKDFRRGFGQSACSELIVHIRSNKRNAHDAEAALSELVHLANYQIIRKCCGGYGAYISVTK